MKVGRTGDNGTRARPVPAKGSVILMNRNQDEVDNSPLGESLFIGGDIYGAQTYLCHGVPQ